MIIRREQPADIPDIHHTTRMAFACSELGHNGEAELVDKLREGCPEALSWVAEIDGTLVGHILFTPAILDGEHGRISGMGLAPMSVSPGRQRAGIGSRLVQTGIDFLRAAGTPFVIVLGHPEFYPKFGFRPASELDVCCDLPDVPPEAFMIQFLNGEPVAGTARYHPLFYG